MDPHALPKPNGTSPEPPPSGPLRYLIRCRRSRFDQRGKSEVQVIEKLTKRLCLDADKVEHIATHKNPRRVHIIVDYDNPTHHRCPLRAFKGNSLKDIRIPDSAADYVHSLVDCWNDIFARRGGRFPVQQGDHVELPPGRRKAGRNGDGEDASGVLNQPNKLDDMIAKDDAEDGNASLSEMKEHGKADDGTPQTTNTCQHQREASPE
jgi:hypothetical protein